MKPTRPFLNYFGGKYNISDWILSYFPAHEVYVEVFGGGLSVFMQKYPCKLEIINDKEGRIVNVYRMARDRNPELKQLLELTPFSRSEFNYCKIESDDELEDARRTICRLSMGVGHSLSDTKTGLRNSKKSSAAPSNSFRNYTEMFDQFHQRMKNCIIENLDWKDCIEKYDDANTFFYFDPPYVHSTRTKSKNYTFEMNNSDHIEFINRINNLKGRCILSGYKNALYESLGWQNYSIETLSNRASKKTETIWLCPKTMGSQKQTSFAV